MQTPRCHSVPRVSPCSAVLCCAALRGAVTSLRHCYLCASTVTSNPRASSSAPTSISRSRQPPSPSPPVRQQCHGARAPEHGASHAATASKLQAIASVHFQRAPRTFTGWPAIPQTSTPGPWLLASRQVAFGLRPKRDQVVDVFSHPGQLVCKYPRAANQSCGPGNGYDSQAVGLLSAQGTAGQWPSQQSSRRWL
jgi:hypothetical protein